MICHKLNLTLKKLIVSLISQAANGSNQINTTINGVKTTIRFYVEGGKIKSIDAFVGWADRVIGKLTAYTTIDGRITSQTTGNDLLYFYYDSDNSLFGFDYNGAMYI